MHARAIFGIGIFILTSHTILSSASKAKSTHHHEQHHKHNEDNEKKSKLTTTNKTLPTLPKLQKGAGFGILAIPTLALAEIFGLGKATKQSGNVKTKRNTTTKINGTFKTVTTVTQQFKLDKKNKSKMIGQSVETVTTSVNKDGGKSKSGLYSDFNPFGSFMFGDEPEPQCSVKKPCKAMGTYCNTFEEQCQLTKKPGSKCDQPNQCSAKGGKYACIWGKCSLVAAAGYSGRFCKKDADCGFEDMHCIPQNDVSEVSDLCVSKAAEGQTCGRTLTMRGFWPFRSRSVSRRTTTCKKGLACVAVGYSGRMICRSAILSTEKTNKKAISKKKETIPNKTKRKKTKQSKHKKKTSH